jgi:hypothetical protein
LYTPSSAHRPASGRPASRPGPLRGRGEAPGGREGASPGVVYTIMTMGDSRAFL